MSAARQPRSVFYDGAAYARLVEPLLRGVHGFIVDHLPEGERVLEACCGTGGLARLLAAAGRKVVGVDLSPRNIDFARTRTTDFTADQLSFSIADVSQIEPPPEGRYDVATIVLALHEMPDAARVPVLTALLRAAARVMVVDFAVPMPWNLAGVRNRMVEVTAGVTHFRAFRDYSRRGGVPALVAAVGAEVESERRIDARTLHVTVLREGV